MAKSDPKKSKSVIKDESLVSKEISTSSQKMHFLGSQTGSGLVYTSKTNHHLKFSLNPQSILKNLQAYFLAVSQVCKINHNHPNIIDQKEPQNSHQGRNNFFGGNLKSQNSTPQNQNIYSNQLLPNQKPPKYLTKTIICPCLKSNGYGHGILHMADILEKVFEIASIEAGYHNRPKTLKSAQILTFEDSDSLEIGRDPKTEIGLNSEISDEPTENNLSLDKPELWFAVFDLSEAKLLRESGFGQNILLLGYFAETDLDWIIENEIRIIISDIQTLELVWNFCVNWEVKNQKNNPEKSLQNTESLPKKVIVHFGLDSGMGREGFYLDDFFSALDFLEDLMSKYKADRPCNFLSESIDRDSAGSSSRFSNNPSNSSVESNPESGWGNISKQQLSRHSRNSQSVFTSNYTNSDFPVILEGVQSHFACTQGQQYLDQLNNIREMISGLQNNIKKYPNISQNLQILHIHKSESPTAFINYEAMNCGSDQTNLCEKGSYKTSSSYEYYSYASSIFQVEMFRPGLWIYGYSLESETDKWLQKNNQKLYPVTGMQTEIVGIKKIKKGDGVGYGHIWQAEQDTWIGVLPVGYRDGLPRALSNKGKVLINNQFYNIIGKICMNTTMIEIIHDQALNDPKSSETILRRKDFEQVNFEETDFEDLSFGELGSTSFIAQQTTNLERHTESLQKLKNMGLFLGSKVTILDNSLGSRLNLQDWAKEGIFISEAMTKFIEF